jgi:hypothetical protein
MHRYFLQVTIVSAQITWIGSPFATTSIGTSSQSIITGSVGAQIKYSKDDGATMPLVSVLLVNLEDGSSRTLAKDFDALSQKCSCYYVDIKTLPKVPDGLSYQLVFQASDGTAAPKEWPSGLIGIVANNRTSIANLTAPMTDEVQDRIEKAKERISGKTVKVPDPKVDNSTISTPNNVSGVTKRLTSASDSQRWSALVTVSVLALFFMSLVV